MILKIMRTKVVGDTAFDKYELIDNIKHIKVSEPVLCTTFGDHRAYDIVVLDHFKCDLMKQGPAACIGCNQSKHNVHRAFVECNNGEELQILFDTRAYILNDSGKTIEIINKA